MWRLWLAAGTTKDYKAKMRSLHFNLKDPHNAELRGHVLRGHISPDNFVQMTATELASEVRDVISVQSFK